ncbi:MAG: sigma-54-dependent Fis family transcriptional regulator [Acidobacteria bacterium]|nr:sigma-54-dependent Fis family transcriptional regulator [Acidobacteriota bacterium]
MAEILIVDDDENMCSAFQRFLEDEGHTPVIVSNAEDALKSVAGSHPDLVIMDIRMPGTDGIEALKQIRQIDPAIYVVIMTAFGTSQTSIDAMRLGAFEYVTKPLDLDDLKSIIDKALRTQQFSRSARSALQTNTETYPLVDLVGKSIKMQEAYKLIGVLATNDVPALLVGEHGVGKQLAARTIHFNSQRKDKPFLAVDCQSVPADSLDAEIFGKEDEGKLERAEGGTLFLAEIQLLSLPLQAKLFRYLMEHTFERAGSTAPIRKNVRVIAATTENLAEGPAQNGQFNTELLDALRVISIELPPLRNRREDIPDLAAHFIRRNNSELNKTLKGVEDHALRALTEHDWPRNVAELERVVKRACILARGEVITIAELGTLEESSMPGSQEVGNALDVAVQNALHRELLDKKASDVFSIFHHIVGRVELTLVREALAIADGNQVKAAEILGLNRTTLRKKMSEETE